MMKQSIEISKKPHIVVATPGRLADLLSSGQVEMRQLRYLVFDEADCLVAPDASFMVDEIPTILSRVGNSLTQWLFFSATMSSAVTVFQNFHRKDKSPFIFNGNTEYGTVDVLEQYFLLVPSQIRDAHLVQLLRESLMEKTLIIFVGKCRTAELLLEMMKQLKMSAVTLHGQMSQGARLASLAKFKSGSISRLITTDVGGRGLDIPSVECVVNFDLPANARDYVHRVGRAARADRKGIAISFVHELDVELLNNIESHLKKKLIPYGDPAKEGDVIKILNEVSVAKHKASLSLHDRKFGEKSKKNKKKWANTS
jgi:ATP-dependent RNA helicase DDX49/DBP8